MRHGTIVSFDTSTTIGEIKLDDGTVVAFGIDQCKQFRSTPTVGMPVVVPEVKTAWIGQPRAVRVLPAVVRDWDREIFVHDLENAVTLDDGFGKRVRLSPSNLAAYFAHDPSWLEDDAAERLVFGRAPTEPTPSGACHPIFGLWREAIERTRRDVAILEVIEGDAAPGGSFLGSEFADIPAEAWPKLRGRRMQHLAQLGVELMRSFGIEKQLNVFLSSFGYDAKVSVVATESPAPRTAQGKNTLAPRALRLKTWRPVYPSCLALGRVHAGDRFFELWMNDPKRKPLPVSSVQRLYEDTFPSPRRLGEPLVVGGYGETLFREGERPYRRLLTIHTRTFSELTRLSKPREGDSAYLAIDYEPETGASWKY